MVNRKIPNGWALAPIVATAEIVRGVSFPKDVRKLEPQPGHVACLRTANVQREVEWDDLWFIPEGYIKVESRYVQPLDVLISVSNSLELVGKVAQVTNPPQRFYFRAAFIEIRYSALLRPSSSTGREVRLLRATIRWPLSQIPSSSRNTFIPPLLPPTYLIHPSNRLSGITLKVPPLPEQHRICGRRLRSSFTRLPPTLVGPGDFRSQPR